MHTHIYMDLGKWLVGKSTCCTLRYEGLQFKSPARVAAHTSATQLVPVKSVEAKDPWDILATCLALGLLRDCVLSSVKEGGE